ncbi:hypothetical protein IU402_05225 [Aerococcaceae bacterium zg-BR9]|uniref:hypothetical protein n=1 Tax=Aerococcaceae bacterium zg-1292 TaxID=2774330 RepID=UPI0040648BA0|nr:hypothetical protein [Aerococcaceae bacterium zg-BR9]
MKKRKVFNKFIVTLTIILCGGLIFPPGFIAKDAYKTYTQDGYGQYVETQAGYNAIGTLDLGNVKLNSPSDLKIGVNQKIYIADSGNRRILIMSMSGELLSEVTHDELLYPTGIDVSGNGKLFVADEKASKVFVFDEKNKIEKIFERPKAPSFGKNATFYPTKIAVDSRENIYVISRGNNNGLIMLKADVPGGFSGYFAPNTARESLLTTFRKTIFTDEQRDRMLSTVPNSITNVMIDNQNLVYTVTSGKRVKESLKKMNMGGRNLLEPNYLEYPSALTMGNYENIYVLSENGYIYEYSSEGDLLFLFSGPDVGYQREGLISKGNAIGIDNTDRIYVLDQQKSVIHLFDKTEFADKLHMALELYQRGKYKKSKSLWQEILTLNSQFDFANLGLAEAFYREENYQDALTYYRKSKTKEGYSDSFWEIRNTWLRKNIPNILMGLLAIFLLIKVFRYYLKKKSNPFLKGEKFSKYTGKWCEKLVDEIQYAFYYMRHPIDGAYGIRFEQKTSNMSTLILYIFFLLTYISRKYFWGYIFNSLREGEYSSFLDGMIITIMLMFISICLYLVVTITDGESTFKQLIHTIIYSLTPFTILEWVMLGLSNILTLNESFIIDFGNLLIIAWVITILFVGLTELNGYRYLEMIRTIFLTLFTVLVLSLTIFIVYTLTIQLISFIVAVFSEVVNRYG